MSNGLRIEVKGARELARSLNGASRQLQNWTPANVAAGKQLVADAIAKAPRRSGRLRASIQSLRVDRVQVTVGSHLRYARYQEYGTRHNRAHYFLTGALAELTMDPYVDYTDEVLDTVRGA